MIVWYRRPLISCANYRKFFNVYFMSLIKGFRPLDTLIALFPLSLHHSCWFPGPFDQCSWSIDSIHSPFSCSSMPSFLLAKFLPCPGQYFPFAFILFAIRPCFVIILSIWNINAMKIRPTDRMRQVKVHKRLSELLQTNRAPTIISTTVI